MLTHIVAVAGTLLIFLLLGVAYFGWGRIAATILGIARQTPASAALPVWLGWTFTLLIFQLLHFFLPITVYVVIPVFALGVFFSISPLLNAWRHLTWQRSTLILVIITFVLALGVAVWIASRAMLTPDNYDSSLYHFNAIRWLNACPIVSGLGNLHTRLAYNQSFFLYVAALNFYPWGGYGRSLANSFLLLLLFATLLPSLLAILRRPSLLIKEHPFAYAVDLFVLPVVAYLALSSDGLASPLPNIASTLLQLAMFVILVHGLAAWMQGQRKQDYRAVLLTVLAATAITVKLSNLAFSAVIISIVLAYVWQTPPLRLRGALRMLLPVCLIILVWTGRGFMLSGAPLFPATIGYVAVAWAVPREKIVDEANWVYSWARQPGVHWSNVLGSWDWFKSWSVNVSKKTEDIIYPLILFIVFGIITIIINVLFLQKGQQPQRLHWSILLPLLLALIYWFFAAPDPRFAHAVFWLLAVSSALLLLTSLQAVLKARLFLATICAVFVIANLHFVKFAVNHRFLLKQVSLAGWHPAPKIALIEKVTSSGLPVYVPASGDQCGDSSLPCTPYFNPKLRLRRPGELASGFTVAELNEAAESSAEPKGKAAAQ